MDVEACQVARFDRPFFGTGFTWHVKAWISCTINIRDDYCLSSSKNLEQKSTFVYVCAKGRVNFMNLLSCFQLEIIMNLAVAWGSYTWFVINRRMSIDNGTSSSAIGMHQVGIEGIQRVSACRVAIHAIRSDPPKKILKLVIDFPWKSFRQSNHSFCWAFILLLRGVL